MYRKKKKGGKGRKRYGKKGGSSKGGKRIRTYRMSRGGGKM